MMEIAFKLVYCSSFNLIEEETLLYVSGIIPCIGFQVYLPKPRSAKKKTTFYGGVMEKFIIEGGIPLSGEVTPSGNKNAALPLLRLCS